jgi:predicted DCC family thiol-disulfide oxidoreductase YuxK
LNNASASAPPEVTVWYDGGCPMCIRETSLMRRLSRPGTIDFVEIHDAVGCPLDTETLLSRFHAQERGQPVVSGAAAFAAMWRAIPVLRPLGLLAKFRPVLWVLERLYLGFLKIRPWLQRRMRQRLQAR